MTTVTQTQPTGTGLQATDLSSSEVKPPIELPFKVGDRVMAVWPGGTQWYQGRVLNNIGKYEVEFDDKTRHLVDVHNVTTIASNTKKSKSARVASPSRPSSPSRRINKGVSPGRSRSRMSPSRARTPSKSPSRRAKPLGTPIRKRSRSRSASRRAPIADNKNVVDVHNVDAQIKIKGRPRKAIAPLDVFDGSKKIVASDSPSKGVNLNDGLRQRDVGKTRMSAKVAALQTARVAGVVTPGLITEGIATKADPISVSPTKIGHKSSRHFLGPVGAFILTFLLPPLILATYLICNKKRCAVFKPVLPQRIDDYLDLEAIYIFFGWLAFQALLFALPIGRLVDGQPLRDGTRLKYRMNGPLAFFISLGAVSGLLYHVDGIADIFLDKLLPMAVTATAFAYILSLILYLRSRYVPVYELSPQIAHLVPNFIYDFFMGRELNPRPFGFDLKMFLELRPGLIGWAALNLIIIWKDYMTHDGQLSTSLFVSAAIQMIYVLDALWFEEALLSTMDVTTEGLGFMLVFGDLVFVPAIFTITSRFLLVEGSVELPAFGVAGIVALFVLGYVVFRASNIQKDEFRCNPFNPPVSYLETINTSYVKKILVGGWWGWVRHPNYFGDLLIALSICLPAGFASVIPYTYFMYLLTILMHRAIRDDQFCTEKYGAAWNEYTTRVRYRIIKYVF